jgi:hypothetical protein
LSIRSPGRAAFAHDGLSALLTPDRFFVRRWRGQIGWRTLFWRDMLAVGTVLNLAASFGALALLAMGAPGAVAVALHFAPMPYNLFLCLALWRMPQRPAPVLAAALAWLVVMTVV